MTNLLLLRSNTNHLRATAAFSSTAQLCAQI
jgi:hypothetical protein